RRPERRDEGLSAPNINIVLRGLPDKFVEQDIEKALVDIGASIDQVSLIKDRETGESRKFAFVKFTSVGHAEEFVTKNYPFIYMDRQRVRIDFSRKEAKQEGAGWRCVKCGKINDEMRRNCLECRMVNPSEYYLITKWIQRLNTNINIYRSVTSSSTTYRPGIIYRK
ncbi:hypothetical protein BGW37DRAFT_420293, partial [Umbelopsis sp. PMI_123]